MMRTPFALENKRACGCFVAIWLWTALASAQILSSSKGIYEEAIVAHHAAIRMMPENKEHRLDYAVAVRDMAFAYLKMGLCTQADQYYQEALALWESRKDEYASDYLTVLYGQARLKNKRGEYTVAEGMLQRALKMAQKNPGKKHPIYVDLLTELSFSYLELSKFKEAKKTIDQAFNALSGQQMSPGYVNASLLMGAYLFYAGDWSGAEKYYLNGIEASKQLYGASHPEYAMHRIYLIMLYSRQGKYNESVRVYDEVYPIMKHHLSEKHPVFAALYTAMGGVYQMMGDNEQAREMLEKSLELSEETLGEWHNSYLTALNSLGLLYIETGELEKAERVLIQSLEIRKSMPGNSNRRIFNAYIQLGHLYDALQNSVQAEYYYREALKLAETDKHTGLFRHEVLVYLGRITLQKGFADHALAYYREAAEVQKKQLGENHPDYLTTLSEIAGALVLSGEEGGLEAEKLYLEVIRKYRERFGEAHPGYLTNLNNLATYYEFRKEPEKAQEVYTLIIEQLDKLSTNSPLTYPFLFNIAANQSVTGNQEKAAIYFLQAFELLKERTQKDLSYLAEGERELLWNSVSFYLSYLKFFSARYKETDPSITTLAYDCEVFSKSLLLNSFQQMQNMLLENEEEEGYLLDLWIDFKSLKGALVELESAVREIDKAMALSLGVDPSLDMYELIRASGNKKLLKFYESDVLPYKKECAELSDYVYQMEKEMFSNSLAGIQYVQNFSVGWSDVKEVLNENEVAIEFISYNRSDFEHHVGGVDEGKVYYALLLRSDSPYPEMLYLCTESELEHAIRTYGYTSEEVHRLVWKPLEGYLERVGCVYMAPSGLLCGLPFSALSHEGQYLIDRYVIHHLFSTKDILRLKEKKEEPLQHAEAVLMGGADFSLSYDELAVLDAELEAGTKVEFRLPDTGEGDLTRGQGFDYLRGSEREVRSIGNLLSQLGWNVSLLVDGYATETRLKSSVLKSSPHLLHLSTHGFYFPLPDYEKVLEDPITLLALEDEVIYKVSDNPLMRSGLVLSGANHAWKGENTLNDGDDGILTAVEVSSLNLTNTRLVVLSACDTGLGDIVGSEGVYGLQRAFRLAGAQAMLVSLWKVPDAETVELMVEFYTHWSGGDGMKEAFTKAQHKLKEKYPDAPEKWAGFVLIE